ncbi:MarR family winged helix-turn-helix transcriptional regulator [Chitinimonas sp. BJYL2]|uniref:MarR family winged helix-turn-helix transcriptional regulator n=1 Tax=Chitinimonas sp. BJYL2 TaxID=2976696 RepID=UPI0022B3FA5C|nr:MarR family transcriptional regulator [Chitinimonas sp. BJYL2]
MKPEDWLRLDAQLCFRLYAASRTVTQCYQPLLAPLGLTYPQYLVMLVLWEEDGLLVKEVGERLRLDSGTLTPLLKRLEQAGHIRRERRAENQREVRLMLTDTGRALQASALGVPQGLAQALGMPVDEIVALRGLLDKLLAQSDGCADASACTTAGDQKKSA